MIARETRGRHPTTLFVIVLLGPFAVDFLFDKFRDHASLMLKQGIHPTVVQERLGHSSISITLDTYNHVTPGLQRQAVEAFDGILLAKIKKPPIRLPVSGSFLASKSGAPRGIRTHDPRFRRPMLYPLSYRRTSRA